MILRTAFALALLTSASAVAFADGTFDRTLQVSGPADLYVSSGSGTIRINPGSDSQVHIVAHIHPGWNAGGDIEDRIRRIVASPPVQQSGNAIHVGEANDRALYNNISVDYEITAPASVALNLRTGSGDIQVNNLGRFLKADTGSGSVRAHGISGSADLHSGSGDIELQQHAPGEVRASTGSGSIRINGLSGSLQASTGSGDIEANGALTGPAALKSGSGSIRLHLGNGAHYNFDGSTGSGSIRVPGSYKSDAHHLSAPINGGGPTLQARTGSGDIEVN